MPASAFEIRRENLRKFILDKFDGNRAAFSRAAEVHQNQVNLLLTDNEEHRRNLGETLARKMEKNVGLPNGWLDESHSGGETDVFTVRSLDVPEQLCHIFRKDDAVASGTFYTSFLTQLAGRITAPENLTYCTVATHDMDPGIKMGDLAMVDVGVKSVTTDGVYVLVRGADVFLRRVSKQLAGGWLIENPSRQSDNLTVDNLKGIKAAGKIIIVWKRSVL